MRIWLVSRSNPLTMYIFHACRTFNDRMVDVAAGVMGIGQKKSVSLVANVGKNGYRHVIWR